MSNTDSREPTRNLLKQLYESGVREETDRVAAESVLRISVQYRTAGTILCTPGQERELAAGFCLNEGLIRQAADLLEVSFSEENQEVSVYVSNVAETAVTDFFARKAKPPALNGASDLLDGLPRLPSDPPGFPGFSPEFIHDCRRKTEEKQVLFPETGGTHVAALFRRDGALLSLAEDVSRHNAMDKAAGTLLLENSLKNAYLGYVSSRAGFEMVHRAVRAGLKILACTSAPTDLAVRAAEHSGLTLIGFARPGRFSIYAGFERILAP